jgi:hypothetical protein
MRPATRTPSRAERAFVQNALGPDERLLAMLQGSDARGHVTWLATNVRVVMLSHATPDDQIASVSHSTITCVEQRTDPVGTWLRLRATGQQHGISNVEPSAASQFCAVVRERAGIGATASSPARPAPVRDPRRTAFTGYTAQSPR